MYLSYFARIIVFVATILSTQLLQAVPPTPLQNFCPVVLVNNSTLDASRVYFVAHGNDPNGFPCFLVPDGNGVCQFVYPTGSGSPSSAEVSKTLNQLPTATDLPPGFTNGYLIYLPINSSSRAYLSIDLPMYLGTAINPALGVMGIQDSSVTSRTDPNFYTLYQDFEFGMVNSVTDSETNLFLNLSWVDYFCLPMQLYTYSYATGQEINIEGTYASGTIASNTRENIISVMNTGLGQGQTYPSWEYLDVPFYDNPYTDTTPSSCVRILAAKNSIDLGKSPQFQGGQVAPEFFPANYGTETMHPPQPSTSFYQAVYNHYLTNTLYAQVFPANEPAENYTITSVSGSPLVLNFAAQSSGTLDVQLDLNNLDFDQLLSGSKWPFTPASVPAAYTNELSKLISALFTIGELPNTGFTTSPGSPFVNNNGGYGALTYFSNPTGYANGPWYNLYDIELHKLQINKGKVPSNPNYGLGYGYDFDDLLNMSGLINGIEIQDGVGNPSQVTDASEPYIIVTLESLSGTTVPNLAQSNQAYQVSMGSAANGTTVSFTYFDGTTTHTDVPASTTVNTNLGMVQVDESNPFIIKFTFDGTDYEYHINVQNQAVLPASATSTYSAIDQFFLNSIVFSKSGGTQSNPQFTITYNSSPPPWAG